MTTRLSRRDDDAPVQAVEAMTPDAPFQAVTPIMPPDIAPVQAVAPVITTMEAMPPVMALGGRLKQQQLLRRRLDGHGCRGREIQ